MKMTRGNAFTLVELLVVVAIISMLAAILLPVLQKARYSAQIIQCTNNQRQIFLALESYADTWDGNYVAVGPFTLGDSEWFAHTWTGRLIHEGHLGIDPPYTDTATDKAIQRHFWCPKKPTGWYWTRRIGHIGLNSGRGSLTGAEKTPLKCSEIVRPSKLFLTGDAQVSGADYWLGIGDPGKVDPRHEGGSPFVYADGHAAFYQYGDYYRSYPDNQHLPFYNKKTSMPGWSH